MTLDEYKQLRLLEEINRKVSRQSWFADLSSNIVGNAIWDGFVWLGSRLIKKL